MICLWPIVLLLRGLAGDGPPVDTVQDTDLSVLRAAQQVFRENVLRVRPGLVRVETMGGSQPPAAHRAAAAGDNDGETPRRRRPQSPFLDAPGSDFVLADGATTGLVYSEDGYIVTSSFNFVREPLLISVTLSDGRRVAADLVARDQVRKVALLRVNTDETGPLTTLPWRDPGDIRVGEWAIAVGVGFGGAFPAITTGIVSATGRMKGYCIQTDARLNPANYGGPLLDRQGRIMGMSLPMSQRPGELADVEMYDSGVGFAITRDKLDEIVAVLSTGKSFYRGWLGIAVNPGARDSVLIANVAQPSPMNTAGVRPGDRILEVDGRSVGHFGQFTQAMNLRSAGDRVRLTVERETERFEITVTLVRADELGALPDVAEPFDPSQPFEPGEPEDAPPAPVP